MKRGGHGDDHAGGQCDRDDDERGSGSPNLEIVGSDPPPNGHRFFPR